VVDQLPHVDLNVLDPPQEKQRQLFDAFQLEIRYDRHLQRITLRVAVRAEMVDIISQAAAEATATEAELTGFTLGVSDARQPSSNVDTRGEIPRWWRPDRARPSATRGSAAASSAMFAQELDTARSPSGYGYRLRTIFR